MVLAIWIPFPVQKMSKNHQTKCKGVKPAFFLSPVSLGCIWDYRQKEVRKYKSTNQWRNKSEIMDTACEAEKIH